MVLVKISYLINPWIEELFSYISLEKLCDYLYAIKTIKLVYVSFIWNKIMYIHAIFVLDFIGKNIHLYLGNDSMFCYPTLERRWITCKFWFPWNIYMGNVGIVFGK